MSRSKLSCSKYSVNLSCISGSETPGLVTVQLETNDGRVLGSTQLTYKEEICSGFQKIVCSANYRGKFMKAFSSNEPSKDSVTKDRNETETGKIITIKTSLFTFYQFLLQAPGEQHIKLWVFCGFLGIIISTFVSGCFLAEMDSVN